MASKHLEMRQRTFIAQYLALHCSLDATCRAFNISTETGRKWMRSPEFRAELARRQEILAGAANVMTAEVIGFLASRMRADIADILPDVEVIKKAREKGISHWIKEYEETTTHKADGSKETRVKLKMVDADKSTALLSKILGLEFRDDAKDRARNAIRGIMALNQCSPHEAIVILAPHNPLVVTLRDEFENNPLLVESK